MKLKEKHFSEVSFITSSIHYFGSGGGANLTRLQKKKIREDGLLQKIISYLEA